MNKERKGILADAEFHRKCTVNCSVNSACLYARALLAEVDAHENARRDVLQSSRTHGGPNCFSATEFHAVRERAEKAEASAQLQQAYYGDKLKEARAMWADRITVLEAEKAVLLSAVKTGVGYEPLSGLEPHKFSEALSATSPSALLERMRKLERVADGVKAFMRTTKSEDWASLKSAIVNLDAKTGNE